MAEIQTIIGSLPVCRGEYDTSTSYFRDNQVTMYGSTFQSIADDNVGYPPAEERDDGKVYAINTDKWIIVANALAAYNAGKRIDDLAENTEIKDEEGAAVKTPFRYIQSEEFIFAKVDANDKLLFGIQWDGTPVFGKTSAVEDRLQSQVTLLAEKVATIMGDEDTTNVIDTMNELKKFFAEIENTQTLTSILENLNSLNTKFGEDIKNLQDTKVDKEEGKSLIDDEVKECFKVIENEEFLHAVVDSEDRLLFGIYRDTGKPYFPLNEMYHVEQNEEFFAVWLDADNHVLLGIRRDGQIIGEIHAVNALKQIISQFQSDLTSLQEKVGTIDTNLKELLDVISLQENPEYMAVETDADGKILSTTNNDGSHYAYNMKSETIPEEFFHIEDPEGRMSMETDAENKIMAYRDKDGIMHENELEANTLHVSSLNLKNNSVNDIQSALIANGFNVKTPIDWSDSSYLQIPIPRCARVNLITDKMPTQKSGMGTSGVNCDIPCYAEFWDMQGNYFKIPIMLSAQGNSSLAFIKKNLAIDLFQDEDRKNSYVIKFGDWVSQDSFHLKAYYTDFFRGVGAVSYMLYEEMAKTRDISDNRPYKSEYTDKYKASEDEVDSIIELDKNIDTGAKCFPQGFPVIVYQNKTFYGIYSWQLKKHRDNMHQDKKKAEHIHLDGTLNWDSIFGGNVNWTSFEVRNPKSLYMQQYQTIKGESTLKYNGDYPYEIIGTDSDYYDGNNKDISRCASVKKYILNLSNVLPELKSAENEGKSSEDIKGLIKKYFKVSFIIDYILETNLINDGDGYAKNWQWTTYDGIQWVVNPYDHDGAFGAGHIGTTIDYPPSYLIGNSLDIPSGWIIKYFHTELEERWTELRKSGIFNAKHITNLLENWCERIGFDNFNLEYSRWDESPCNRKSFINSSFWKLYAGYKLPWYSSTKYNTNDVVSYGDRAFKSLKDNNININPGNDDGTNWENVTYNPEKQYSINEECYFGKTRCYGFKCIKDCKGEPPFTAFYKEFPNESGHFDSIYRVKKWIEVRISYMDNLLNYK
jgi:hypothetical protein